MKSRRTIELAAGGVTALIMAGLSTGSPIATAAPEQTPGTRAVLYQDPANAAYMRVGVEGLFPMSEYDAHGFINNIGTGAKSGGVEYAVRADDEGSDDATIVGLWKPGAGSEDDGALYALSDGVHFSREITVPKTLLDEDSQVLDQGVDEIYVTVRFVDGDGVVRTAHSNVLSANFELL